MEKYTTIKGDTLMAVAFKVYQDAAKWQKIGKANRGKLGPDWNKPRKALRKGMVLNIPR